MIYSIHKLIILLAIGFFSVHGTHQATPPPSGRLGKEPAFYAFQEFKDNFTSLLSKFEEHFTRYLYAIELQKETQNKVCPMSKKHATEFSLDAMGQKCFICKEHIIASQPTDVVNVDGAFTMLLGTKMPYKCTGGCRTNRTGPVFVCHYCTFPCGSSDYALRDLCEFYASFSTIMSRLAVVMQHNYDAQEKLTEAKWSDTKKDLCMGLIRGGAITVSILSGNVVSAVSNTAKLIKGLGDAYSRQTDKAQDWNKNPWYIKAWTATKSKTLKLLGSNLDLRKVKVDDFRRRINILREWESDIVWLMERVRSTSEISGEFEKGLTEFREIFKQNWKYFGTWKESSGKLVDNKIQSLQEQLDEVLRSMASRHIRPPAPPAGSRSRPSSTDIDINAAQDQLASLFKGGRARGENDSSGPSYNGQPHPHKECSLGVAPGHCRRRLNMTSAKLQEKMLRRAKRKKQLF